MKPRGSTKVSSACRGHGYTVSGLERTARHQFHAGIHEGLAPHGPERNGTDEGEVGPVDQGSAGNDEEYLGDVQWRPDKARQPGPVEEVARADAQMYEADHIDSITRKVEGDLQGSEQHQVETRRA